MGFWSMPGTIENAINTSLEFSHLSKLDCFHTIAIADTIAHDIGDLTKGSDTRQQMGSVVRWRVAAVFGFVGGSGVGVFTFTSIARSTEMWHLPVVVRVLTCHTTQTLTPAAPAYLVRL